MLSQDILEIGKRLRWHVTENSVCGKVNGYLFTLYSADEYMDLYIHLPLLSKDQKKKIRQYLNRQKEEWQIDSSFYKNSTYMISFFNPAPQKDKQFINVDEAVPITAEILIGYLNQLTVFLSGNNFAGNVCVFCGNPGASEELIVNHCLAYAHEDCAGIMEKKLNAALPKLPFVKHFCGVLGSIVGSLFGIALFITLSLVFPIIASAAGYFIGWLSYLFYKWFAGSYSVRTKATSLIISVLSIVVASAGVLLIKYFTQTALTGLASFFYKDSSVYYIGLNLVLGLLFALYGAFSSIAPKLSKSISMKRLQDPEVAADTQEKPSEV